MENRQRQIGDKKDLLQSTHNRYRYKPLTAAKKQIHIFRLAPGGLDQPIRGSLIIINLDRLRRRKWKHIRLWSALSYIWGLPDRTMAINVSRKKLYITPTLYSALRYLRWSEWEQYLWVDQLCINQKDLAERAQQVPLMREIYAQATYVVAWFGAGNSSLENLLRMLRDATPLFEVFQGFEG